MSEEQRVKDYLASFGLESNTVETTIEWGVEMNATMLGKPITKVFQWRDRAEAENDAAYRNTLSFVNWARVVSREVTATPWEEV
ncbi:hypothetical protein [Pseudarthrobacter cellobiosi]|uniref:hypothetical protein n=1 Tax=Pseudarthrobacter cellobiosi TaxID=2953654 RepID=UPI00208E209C|nr:hypothetical protein [Pseudarthrobacter sp. HLT1-5]MCO4257386.1 hypothetical protein [Pseudarthrobacter sp. HLT1-5]